MTCKDTFLSKIQFQQLLYVAVCGLPGKFEKDENIYEKMMIDLSWLIF